MEHKVAKQNHDASIGAAAVGKKFVSGRAARYHNFLHIIYIIVA